MGTDLSEVPTYSSPKEAIWVIPFFWSVEVKTFQPTLLLNSGN